jgi:two-component system LytT family response regulator
LSRLEQQLDPTQFVRVHRTTIVRAAIVRETRPLSNGDRLLILTDGTELMMSRSYRDKVRTSLGSIFGLM